jgi:hypothetical protein
LRRLEEAKNDLRELKVNRLRQKIEKKFVRKVETVGGPYGQGRSKLMHNFKSLPVTIIHGAEWQDH